MFQEKALLPLEMTVQCLLFPLEDLPVGQDVEWKTVILMILTLCRSRLMCVFMSLFLTKKESKNKKLKIKKKLIKYVCIAVQCVSVLS